MSGLVAVEGIQDFAVEIVFFVSVVVRFCVLSLELVSVHSISQLGCNFSNTVAIAILCLLHDKPKGLNESFFWVVEVRQLNGKIESVNKLIRFVLNAVSEVYEVLVHYKSLLTLIGR